mgnify:CR=1 FL=1
MIRYYHATPYDNLMSILSTGLEPQFGEIYCSTSQETAVRWVSFTRMYSDKICVLSFDKEDGDDTMRIGNDHSPIMTKLLGVDDEGASYVSTQPIPASDLNWDDIVTYDNPFYSEEFAKQHENRMKHNRKILEKMEEE